MTKEYTHHRTSEQKRSVNKIFYELLQYYDNAFLLKYGNTPSAAWYNMLGTFSAYVLNGVSHDIRHDPALRKIPKSLLDECFQRCKQKKHNLDANKNLIKMPTPYPKKAYKAPKNTHREKSIIAYKKALPKLKTLFPGFKSRFDL